jgi:diguanylate cyclase (GGDEF)-like protein
MKLHEEIFMMNGYDGKSEGVDMELPRPTSNEPKETSYEISIKDHAELLVEIKDLAIEAKNLAIETKKFAIESRDRAIEEKNRALDVAYKDHLTGISNRLSFTERLNQETMNPNAEITLLMIDLDKFKQANDEYGHQVGDRVLMEVASRIVHCVERSDMVARLGGDEFVVIHRAKDVSTLASLIVKKISEPYHVDSHTIVIGCSIGISVRSHQESPSQIIKQADLTMYRAKQQGGKSFLFYDPKIDNDNIVTRHR